MRIHALRAFRLTLIEGSIAAAARKMNLSQPAVSRLVSGLESGLRLELFERSGKRLIPTANAYALLEQADRVLSEIDAFPHFVDQLRAGHGYEVRVVAAPRIAAALVSPAISRFVADHPEASISVDVRARREASQWLASRQYDLGVGALPFDHPDLDTSSLLRVRAQAVIPRHHRLARRSRIAAEHIAHEPLVVLLKGLLLRDQVDDWFRAAGIVPRYQCEVASSSLACQLAADGCGITIADAVTAAELVSDRVVLRPIEPERWMTFGLLLPRHRRLSRHGQLLLCHLHNRARELASRSNHVRYVTDRDGR